MTRRLVDVLMEAHVTEPWESYDDIAQRLVASLLADGPAEHTIVCPTCEGSGRYDHPLVNGPGVWAVCPDCANGRRVVLIGVLP